MRKTILGLALSVGTALPALAQIGSPVDLGGNYVGPFGPTAVGGTPSFAQTFTRPAGMNYLQSFSFFLGDNNPDASGTQFQFQAAVFEVNGTTLTNQLFASPTRSGSANYVSFDTYSFNTPNLLLTPGINTFALVLRSISSANGALNVIAAGGTDYAGGAFFSVANNALSPAIDATGDAGFNATFSATVTSVVPEPSSLLLMAAGLSAMMVVVVKRKRA